MACNPSTQEVEAGGSPRLGGCPAGTRASDSHARGAQIHMQEEHSYTLNILIILRKLQASQGCIERPSLETKQSTS